MPLSREQKIAKAQKMRRGGLLYREIAEELGVHETTICEWVTGRITAWKNANPEKVRQSNLARNDAKREWEDAQRADCPQCGQQMGAGTTMPSRSQEKCIDCRSDDARRRTVRFIELREQGLTNIQIAEREGVLPPVVAVVFNRADRYGLEVPVSPYWRRKEQVAA